MRYHGDRHVLPLFGPWRWAPYMRGNFHWKKYQNARSFFLSHTSKLNQQKQWEVVSKNTAKIYPSNKYNIFPSFIIDQSWNTLQLKNIVLSFHPPFEPISALFTFTGLWPKRCVKDYFRKRRNRLNVPVKTILGNIGHFVAFRTKCYWKPVQKATYANLQKHKRCTFFFNPHQLKMLIS